MADVDLYGEEGGAARQPVAESETQFLQKWDPEIRRAASAHAFGRMNPDYEADELAQQARIKVLRLYRGGKTRALPYIRTSIANAVRTPILRDPVLVQAEELPDDTLVSEDSDVELDYYVMHEVRSWVRSLPPQLQAVYKFLYVRGLTQREAAERMGVTQARIAQLHRALLQMGASGLHKLAA